MSPLFRVKIFELHIEAFHHYKGILSIREASMRNSNILTRKDGDINQIR